MPSGQFSTGRVKESMQIRKSNHCKIQELVTIRHHGRGSVDCEVAVYTAKLQTAMVIWALLMHGCCPVPDCSSFVPLC